MANEREGIRRSTENYDTVTHASIPEELKMNKYHLLWVLQSLPRTPSNPYLEYMLIALALFLGTLFALLPADFRDYLGLKAEVWEAIAVLLATVTAIAVIILFCFWIRVFIRIAKAKVKTPEEIVEELIDQMETDRERLGG